MEEEDDDFYGTNGNAPVKHEDAMEDEGDDNQSEQMDEDGEDESDSVRKSVETYIRTPAKYALRT